MCFSITRGCVEEWVRKGSAQKAASSMVCVQVKKLLDRSSIDKQQRFICAEMMKASANKVMMDDVRWWWSCSINGR
jgi:hypothetical protein